MSDLAVRQILPPPTSDEVEFARRVEADAMLLPQVDIKTIHTLHAGLYVRTVLIPKGVLITGTQIKIPTVLILSGDCLVYGGPLGAMRFTGYHVLEGQAGRKQVFHAIEDTWLSMQFATSATTVEQAEEEFTDETDKLLSRRAA